MHSPEGVSHPRVPGPEFKVAMLSTPEPRIPAWVVSRLSAEGILYVHQECETEEEVVEAAGDSDVAWIKTSRHLFSREAIARLPRCLAILRSGTGTENIDVEAASEAGIVVANTPDAVTETVADHTVAFMLTLARRIPYHDRMVRSGRWDPMSMLPSLQLLGATVGLIGFGRIARSVVQRLVGFKTRILAFDPYVSEELIEAEGAEPMTLEGVLSRSDFVCILVPSTSETVHLIGEHQLRLMRPGSYLVNTARGSIVDEDALYRALSEGWIAGAALDVLEHEPPDLGSPLLQLDNVVTTQHVAAVSDKMRHDMWQLATETILDLHDGFWPRSVVNPWVKPRRPLRPRPERRIVGC